MTKSQLSELDKMRLERNMLADILRDILIWGACSPMPKDLFHWGIKALEDLDLLEEKK